MAKQEIQEEPVSETPVPSGRKKTLIMVGVVLGVMLFEGVGVFFLARHFGGAPAAAAAAEAEGLDPHGGKKAALDQEVEVVKFRAQNEKAQQPLTYEMTVAAVISEKDQARVSETLGRKKATIQDRLSRVVRAMDPQRFTEPDLATIREQFRHELSQIVGEEGAIKEVLIPSMARFNEN